MDRSGLQFYGPVLFGVVSTFTTGKNGVPSTCTLSYPRRMVGVAKINYLACSL